MVAKQPTATAFTRTQESWARFVLDKVQKKIDEREQYLIVDLGWKEEHLSDDPVLMDLYDDEFFFERYAEEMEKQRDYIRENYL